MNIDSHKFNIRFCKIMKKHPELYDSDSKEYANKELRERAWIDVATEMDCEPKVLKARWKNLRGIFLKRLMKLHKGETEHQYYLFPYIKFLIPYFKPRSGPKALGSTLTEHVEAESEPDDELDNLYDTESNENVEEIGVSQQNDDSKNPLYNEEDVEAMHINPPKKLKRSVSSECIVGIEDDFLEGAQQHYEYETPNNEIPNNHFSYNEHNKQHSLNYNQTSSVDDNPKRHFLLSLLPDLDDMTKTQMRQFKIKVLTMIDDILKDT